MKEENYQKRAIEFEKAIQSREKRREKRRKESDKNFKKFKKIFYIVIEFILSGVISAITGLGMFVHYILIGKEIYISLFLSLFTSALMMRILKR